MTENSNIDQLLNNMDANYTTLLSPVDKIEILNLSEISPDSSNVRSSGNIGYSESEEEGSNSLADLATSIKELGVQQPIIVRKNPDTKSKIKYIIVCGERRYRASLKAGKKDIPAIVKKFDSDLEVKTLQITENVQRQDLNNFELAACVQQMKELYQEKNGKKMKQVEIAKILGKNANFVTRIEKFADCPLELLEFFKSGIISPSVRCGAQVIDLYKEAPEKVINWLNGQRKIEEVVDIPKIEDFERYLRNPVMNNPNLSIQDPTPEILDGKPSTYDEGNERAADQEPAAGAETKDQADGQAENQATENNAGSFGGSVGYENSDSEDEDGSGYDEDEYPDKQEREKSATPKMAPKHQENSEHTAGLGKPTYTDRDTRRDHDLSDDLEYQERKAARQSIDEDPDLEEEGGDEDYDQQIQDQSVFNPPHLEKSGSLITEISCIYHDPETDEEEEYVLDLRQICDNPQLGHIRAVNGDDELDVKLSDLRLVRTL